MYIWNQVQDSHLLLTNTLAKVKWYRSSSMETITDPKFLYQANTQQGFFLDGTPTSVRKHNSNYSFR